MALACVPSRLWYNMVLLVCPTKSTVCWTKSSKSSMVKSASSSGTVVALSRACHTFYRGPMISIFLSWISSSIAFKAHTNIWIFSFKRWDINSSSFFTSMILEETRFPVKIGSIKSRSYLYWLKWEKNNYSEKRWKLNSSSSAYYYLFCKLFCALYSRCLFLVY